MPIADITLDCGRFQVFENYIIGTINQGVLFDSYCQTAFSKITETYFKDRYFGYISNRVNSYSVDPTIYINDAIGFERLKVMAVVTKGYLHKSNVQLERQFFKAELQTFNSIADATLWISDKLSYSKSSSLST